MEMNNSIKGNCKFSSMINCFGTANCMNCGWNPVVKQARVKKIMKELAREAKKKPKHCPMQGHTTIDQKRNFGIVVSCHNSNCSLLPNGECVAFAKMLEYWAARCGLQMLEPSEKVEITHEQPN